MSQSQEIAGIYKRLKEANDGLSVEDLVYAPEGFLYSKYPEEWNKVMGRFCYPGVVAPVAPEQVGVDIGFHGDIVYCERLWTEFEDWLEATKGIKLKTATSSCWF